MGLGEVTRQSVLNAVSEYDKLGQAEFLTRYGFHPSRIYLLLLNGKTYDSKAIIGAAHRYATGTALTAAEFSGGQRTVVRTLTELGFEVKSHAVTDFSTTPTG